MQVGISNLTYIWLLRLFTLLNKPFKSFNMITINRKEAENIKLFTRIVMTGVAIFTILMLSFAVANAGERHDKSENQISRQVNKMIDYPESILASNPAQSSGVVLYFWLDNDGVIDVYRVDGVNEPLAEYVANSVDGQTIKNQNGDQKYQLPIQFKTQ